MMAFYFEFLNNTSNIKHRAQTFLTRICLPTESVELPVVNVKGLNFANVP